jgi:hypothetical protein
MGIHDKKPSDKDKNYPWLDKEFDPRSLELTEREVLENRLFEHSEWKKPYLSDDYQGMERKFTLPRALGPFNGPTPPEPSVVPPRTPGTPGASSNGPADESQHKDGSCDCGGSALRLVGMGGIEGIRGTNDCGEEFGTDSSGEFFISQAQTLCLANKWDAEIPLCPAPCEKFLILEFMADGYPFAIQWNKAGAGGTLFNSYASQCSELGVWRVPLEDLFKDIDCNSDDPKLTLMVDTVSPNCDGTECTGRQTIVLKPKTVNDDGSSSFSMDCLLTNEEQCPSPESSWQFSICLDGVPLRGKDAFGTDEMWEWIVGNPSEFSINPLDAYATEVVVSVVGTPSSCTLGVRAQHPCDDRVAPDRCLAIDHATCDWIVECDDIGFQPGNQNCDGDSLPAVRLQCSCPDVKRIYSLITCLPCSAQPGGGQTCAEVNADNECASDCPQQTAGSCKGSKSEYANCMTSKGIGESCSPACDPSPDQCVRQFATFRKETWGKI